MNDSIQADWRARRRMPGLEAYAHGTRARYVCGCRCAPCRASNRRRYHERQLEAKERAREIDAPPAGPLRRVSIRNGKAYRCTYKRKCPGVGGEPCPIGAYLRKDSVGGICGVCRERLVWGGIVPADAAREHIRKLSRAGVGYKTLADASGVGSSIIFAIRSGRRYRIRASTARRILAVDRGAIADQAIVPAGRAWQRIRLLREEGFSKAELARRMGYRSPALQLGRKRITARNASRVERLYRRCMT